MLTDAELFKNLYEANRNQAPGRSQDYKSKQHYKWGETDTLMLVSCFENGYLLHLDTGQVTYMNWFYGDPTSGILSQDSKWAVMTDFEQITIWNQGQLNEIEFQNSYDIRQINETSIYILTDPYEENAAIWELNVYTLAYNMIRPFPDYIGKEWQDEIIW